MGAQRQVGGSIKKVETARGPRWRFRVDLEPTEDGKRRQRTITCASEAEAITQQARLRHDIATGVHVDKDGTALAAYLDAWLEANRHHWRPSTYTSYMGVFKPVKAALGTKRLQDIKRTDLEKLSGDMLRSGGRHGKGRSPRTVALCLTVLHHALEDAVIDGLLARNPADHVRKPRQQRKEMHTWSADEAGKFLRHVDGHRLVGAFHLTLRGLRRGEVMGLRWGDIDLDKRTATIRHTRLEVDGKMVDGEPKTDRGRRTVPLDEAAVRALRLTRERTLGTEVVPLRPGEPIEDRFVVVDELGDPMRSEVYGDLFVRLGAAAGLPRIRLHDARHTAATLMLQGGTPVHVVARFLGHDPAVTLKTYAHVDDSAAREAADRLGTLLG